MALKVSSWVECGKEELIPTCKANNTLEVTIGDEKYEDLEYNDDVDLELCWKYFARNYECYCLEPKYDCSIKNYIFNLHNFQFSFRESATSSETKSIFTMKKEKQCLIWYYDWYYVSDTFGFALMYLNASELEVYYFDFEQKFTSNISTDIPDYTSREIKLCYRSIWIVTDAYDESYVGCLIDVIKVISEREWYHVRTNICSPISLEMVFSGVMLIVNDIIVDPVEEKLEINFSSCKALYIDHNNLIPYETNKRNFIDFYKPKELEIEKLLVLGIFESTIILIPRSDHKGDIAIEFRYFVSYNESLQLRFCKRIDLTISSNPGIRILWNNPLEISHEVGKMFLIASENMVFVIDLRRIHVSQIFEYASPFSAGKFFKWSKQDGMLNIKVNTQCPIGYPCQRFYMKYVLYNGLTLKGLALNIVAEFFSLEKIQSSNLPQSLTREIMTRKNALDMKYKMR